LFGVRTNQHLQGKRKILSTPPQRTKNSDVSSRKRARRSGNMTTQRNNVVARLVAIHTAVVSRVADRAADVATEFETGESGGERSRGPAGGPARRTREIPGVIGHPEKRVITLRVHGEDRRVGLAEADCDGRH